MISKSFAPVRSAMARGTPHGTICRAAPTHWINGPDRDADAIGLKPLLSGAKTEDEGLFVVQHRYWKDALVKAVAG